MKKKVTIRLSVFMTLGLLACSVDGAGPEPAVATTQAALTAADPSVVPDDATRAGSTPAPPTDAVKAPPLRKATVDEIEELNATFRTQGSRDRLLRRIQAAGSETRDRLAAYYVSVALRNLPEAEKAQAQASLSRVLAGAPAQAQ